MLGDLIAELARLQAVMNKLKAARREIDAESFRRQLEHGQRQAAMLSERFPFLGTILRCERVRKRTNLCSLARIGSWKCSRL